LRTFALISLAGTLFALLSERAFSPWILAAGLLIVGGMLISAYSRHTGETDPGTTTIMAAIVSYGLGALVWYDETILAASLAIAVTGLLYFRTELHGVTRALTRRDLVSLLQFSVLAFVLLPILPDKAYGPYGALNPYRIGLLVVLISGTSFAGYAALRIVGEQRGAFLIGLLGGLASTTATTLVYSRHARQDIQLTPLATSVILISNLVLFLRLAFLAVVIAPQTAAKLVPMLLGGFIAGAIYVAVSLRRGHSGPSPTLELTNPTELRAAFGFAVLYSVVSLGLHWSREIFGTLGVYVGAFLSGLTDLDAISVTSLRMSTSGAITQTEAVTAIMVAYLANTILKLGIVIVVGPRTIMAPVFIGFCAAALGAVAGWLVS